MLVDSFWKVLECHKYLTKCVNWSLLVSLMVFLAPCVDFCKLESNKSFRNVRKPVNTDGFLYQMINLINYSPQESRIGTRTCHQYPVNWQIPFYLISLIGSKRQARKLQWSMFEYYIRYPPDQNDFFNILQLCFAYFVLHIIRRGFKISTNFEFLK